MAYSENLAERVSQALQEKETRLDRIYFNRSVQLPPVRASWVGV